MVTGTPATVTVFFSFTVVLLLRLRCRPAARGAAGQRERIGAVLAGADLGQGTAGRFPAGGPTDRQRDFADADDVADGQGPQPAREITAGQFLAFGVAGVVVERGVIRGAQTCPLSVRGIATAPRRGSR